MHTFFGAESISFILSHLYKKHPMMLLWYWKKCPWMTHWCRAEKGMSPPCGTDWNQGQYSAKVYWKPALCSALWRIRNEHKTFLLSESFQSSLGEKTGDREAMVATSDPSVEWGWRSWSETGTAGTCPGSREIKSIFWALCSSGTARRKFKMSADVHTSRYWYQPGFNRGSCCLCKHVLD